ncbi:MAG: hypothetical protein NTY42_09495 [Planctomycetota bacterium]|nr:hypothetical protein [Planctomycetota bacterium]
MIPVLAIAGSLARKKNTTPGAGTLRTDSVCHSSSKPASTFVICWSSIFWAASTASSDVIC